MHLNFHHLRYFRAVAKDGNLTRTAERLGVAQSALSSQIRLLEEQLGQMLFSRERRGLTLTEAGRFVLTYAEDIFAAGEELVCALKERRSRDPLLRVGAVATLSRNFQESFLRPALSHPEARLRVTSGSLEELLTRLADHELDVVLSNRPAQNVRIGAGRKERPFRSRRLARQPVSLVSTRPDAGFTLPRSLDGRAMILPGLESALRVEFDALCERLGVRPRILAEVDDMATMRLLARDTDTLVLVPSVVVRDELTSGLLHEVCVLPEVTESFYATTTSRRFQHPLLPLLLNRDDTELLSVDAAPSVGAHRQARPASPRRRRPHGSTKAKS
jgi:LysR family transcriptional activator of nhaA